MPLGLAKFHMNWCSESPVRGENVDFSPLSNFNIGSLPLRGNPAGKKNLRGRFDCRKQTKSEKQ